MTHPPAVETRSQTALAMICFKQPVCQFFLQLNKTRRSTMQDILYLRTEKKLSILRTAVTEVFYVLFWKRVFREAIGRMSAQIDSTKHGELQAPNLSTGMILQECRRSAHSPFGGLVIEYQNNRYMMILIRGRYCPRHAVCTSTCFGSWPIRTMRPNKRLHRSMPPMNTSRCANR